jgi:lipoprotein
MKQILFLLLTVMFFSCGSDDDSQETKKETYKVRYELTCSDSDLYNIQIEYLEHKSNEVIKKEVEAPYKFEQELNGTHIIDITATLITKENTEGSSNDASVGLKIYINDILKYEGTEKKTIYKTLAVI